jgi:hypothetical protein
MNEAQVMRAIECQNWSRKEEIQWRDQLVVRLMRGEEGRGLNTPIDEVSDAFVAQELSDFAFVRPNRENRVKRLETAGIFWDVLAPAIKTHAHQTLSELLKERKEEDCKSATRLSLVSRDVFLDMAVRADNPFAMEKMIECGWRAEFERNLSWDSSWESVVWQWSAKHMLDWMEEKYPVLLKWEESGTVPDQESLCYEARDRLTRIMSITELVNCEGDVPHAKARFEAFVRHKRVEIKSAAEFFRKEGHAQVVPLEMFSAACWPVRIRALQNHRHWRMEPGVLERNLILWAEVAQSAWTFIWKEALEVESGAREELQSLLRDESVENADSFMRAWTEVLERSVLLERNQLTDVQQVRHNRAL